MSEQREDFSGRFRPRAYILTGGRTRSSVELPIESMLVPTKKGIENAKRLTSENQDILNLCIGSSVSIAEVSAHLHIPLGVTRVLAGDLITHELIKVSVPNYHAENKDRLDRQLLEKVLEGLEAL